MSIHVMTLTTIHCDGPAERPCPQEAFKIYSFPQTIALRLARKEGWQVDELSACPMCAGVPAALPAPVNPTGQHRLVRIEPGHPSVDAGLPGSGRVAEHGLVLGILELDKLPPVFPGMPDDDGVALVIAQQGRTDAGR